MHRHFVLLTKGNTGSRKYQWSFRIASIAACFVAQAALAKEVGYTQEQMRVCLERSVLTAEKNMTVKRLEEACALLLSKPVVDDTKPGEVTEALAAPGVRLLNDRIALESLNRSNRFVLTPHKRNYILPISYVDSPNNEPYREADAADESETGSAFRDLRHTEFEFQLSVKILLRENLLGDNGHLFFGYTNHSFWQVYNRKTSAPFRETNHQPELILSFNNDLEIFGFRNLLNEISLTHQSNGQSGVLSRSWNRIIFNSVFEGENVGFAIAPWYRLPEDRSRYPGDPDRLRLEHANLRAALEWLLDDGDRQHLRQYLNAGVIALLFGRGADGATDASDAAQDGNADPPPINGNDRPSLGADDDGGYFGERAAAY